MAAESSTPDENIAMVEHIEAPVKRHIIAAWQVPIRGKLYNIEFEHGTTSGKRVLLVDGKVSIKHIIREEFCKNLLIF